MSRDATATAFHRPDLAELPVTVDWFGHRKGVRWTRHELGRRLADGVAADGPVGVMLHHAVCDDDDRDAVAALLALLQSHPAATPVRMADLSLPGCRAGR